MEPVVARPKTLGVTGGIGSGKTTVCRMLAEMGAAVFYADDAARTLMEVDCDIRRELMEAFGSRCYRQDGSLDRGYLGGIVFESRDYVSRLNAIVHPRVHQEFRRRHSLTEAALLVHEAALIFESGSDAHLDLVAVVDAPLEVRYGRIYRRDGLSCEAIQARMQHQLPRAELLQRADWVVDNSRTPDDLRAEAARLFRAATVPVPPVV